LIVFETVPCLDEALAISELTRSSAPKPVWVSLCCRNESELSSGEPLSEAAGVLSSAASVVALGVNCVSPRTVSSLIQILKDATSKPVFVYPNLGQVWDSDLRAWQGRVDEAAFLGFVDEWRALGAAGIGGCCGVDSALVRAVGNRLREPSTN
jgi:homocysteine S-methyltransferase